MPEDREKRLAKYRRYYQRHRERRLEQARQRREQYPDEIAESQRLWREANREYTRQYRRDYDKEHPDRVAETKRRYHASKRRKVLEHYGTSCACCGATNLLEVDHIVPYTTKSPEPRKAPNLDIWLVKNNFPPGFQILCRGCNRSKARGPHCRMHN